MTRRPHREGFTLIELSIVLVIIGLIVGGILVGQDLIHAATVRAQISQIEKYNQAVNTFRGKFGALPGDMPVATANQFGFAGIVNGIAGGPACRDANGLIDGGTPPSWNFYEGQAETELFWQDLGSPVAGPLIDGTFPNSGAPGVACNDATNATSITIISQYLPPAKIGHGMFIYVYETSGYNWYGLSAVTALGNLFASTATIPVIQAYNLDRKMDDGLPTTGVAQAVYVQNYSATQPASNAPADSKTTCYNTTTNAYSIGSLANYGTAGNCALSFRFQ